jgi:hypothetical protein
MFSSLPMKHGFRYGYDTHDLLARRGTYEAWIGCYADLWSVKCDRLIGPNDYGFFGQARALHGDFSLV